MVPHSKWLWRYLIGAIIIVALYLPTSILTIIFFSSHHHQLEPTTQAIYIMFVVCTPVNCLVTFAIVFKKTIHGTFGYDESRKLLLKFRVLGMLSLGCFTAILPIFVFSPEHSLLFGLSTIVNSLCFALLAKTYMQEHTEIRRYLHYVMLINSHKGVTLSVHEAHICFKLDVERTKLESALSKEHRSSAFEALRNIEYYSLMRWLHKLRLLAAANERERQWRISELYHEINEHASNFQLDERNSSDWKQLADQLAVAFPFSRDSEFANYENKDYNEELESVD